MWHYPVSILNCYINCYIRNIYDATKARLGSCAQHSIRSLNLPMLEPRFAKKYTYDNVQRRIQRCSQGQEPSHLTACSIYIWFHFLYFSLFLIIFGMETSQNTGSAPFCLNVPYPNCITSLKDLKITILM